VTLAPLQQANSTTFQPHLWVVDQVNVDTVLDWKEGLFVFKSDNIFTLMRKISLWYDVDIEFADLEAAERSGNRRTGATGSIPRSASLAQVLRVLERAGLKFEVKGRLIIVHS
jgi:transmembrane sensor